MTDEHDFIGYMPEGSSQWQFRRGTIQEVLNTLSSLRITAEKVIYYTDDGTNAVVIFCKRK
jgi:hypothetical protein